jgi:hypothetical protein
MSRSGKRVKTIPPRHSDEGTIEKRMSFCSKLESKYPSVTLCMHPHKTYNFRFTKSKGRGEKSKKRDAESKGRGEICREQKEGGGGRRLNVTLELENILFILAFFLSASWLNRFGSVQSISDFRNRNRTEPEFFCDFLIG